MRILVVSNLYPPRAIGGAELVAHRHALELKRRGHEVLIFAGRPPKSNQSGGEMDFEVVDGLDAHVLSLRSLEPERAFHWDAAGRRFRSVLQDFHPDVVHFHNVSGLGVNLILEAKRFGARTVCTVHDHWGFCAKNTRYRDEGYVCVDFEGCHFCISNVADENGKALPTRLRRDFVMRCLGEVDHLVFPSAYLKSAYAEAGFDVGAAHVQSNGVEVGRFEPSIRNGGSEPLRFVFVGYLGAHKGVDLLIEMVDRLLADSTLDGRWRLVIAGDGHLRARISRLVEEAPYRNHLEFLGKLDAAEIPKLLENADVVLLPSVWPENEPVVMLEAIAAGRAQLASRIGGHPELVADGQSGQLFTSGDLDDLVKKAVAYIQEPDRARRHGAFNRARRDAFDQAAAVSAYEKIYEAAPAKAFRADRIVLCDGQWPTLETAQFFNSFSVLERGRKFRFVYAEWADARLWEHASALFLWSHHANTRFVLRAARMNIPVVAPADGELARLCEQEGLGGFAYNDFAEAISALMTLCEKDRGEAGDSLSARDLVDCTAALVEPSAFGLYAERPAT